MFQVAHSDAHSAARLRGQEDCRRHSEGPGASLHASKHLPHHCTEEVSNLLTLTHALSLELHILNTDTHTHFYSL